MLPGDCYVLLHEVRLRGLVEVDDSDIVTQLLDAGLIVRARAAVRITGPGRAAHASWARVMLGSDAAVAAQRGYERFLPLNTEFMRVCHDWQVRPGDVPNDHCDARYDWEVIDRLRALDERAAPVVRRVARYVERFGPYSRRLRAALGKVDDGDYDWFTSPRLDSYHTVWMQLHEDLLLALGIERTDET
ncbi:MAG: MarR family transcriptional regulator [Actinomycetota bacterium]